jgi:polysaccharide deacetylase 2 family uncharacterized protein YibQ
MPTMASKLLLGSLLVLALGATHAAPPVAPIGGPIVSPIVSIVIDDLGNNPREDRRALALRAPVAAAILPHTASSQALADEARRAGKEVLLHLPMDPEGNPVLDTGTEAGPGRLETHMSAPEIAAMLLYDLQTVPHAVGVNNHMGSRLTQNTAAMNALMQALRQRGNLFFLDSRTSPHSVAARIAVELDVPTLERDVFLDSERGDEAVRHALSRLDRLLLVRGHAIAIGHPYPETLAALERWLPAAAARGIRVVPLSVMLERHKKEPEHAARPVATRPGL